jgi:hypothetical protein
VRELLCSGEVACECKNAAAFAFKLQLLSQVSNIITATVKQAVKEQRNACTKETAVALLPSSVYGCSDVAKRTERITNKCHRRDYDPSAALS